MANAAPPDYAERAKRYAHDVRKHRIVACKYVRLACERHVSDLKRSLHPEFPYKFDPWHANDVCGFVEKMPHVEGHWDSPTLALEDWQIFKLASVFGWRRKDDGGRRFSDVYDEVARKNAKSTLVAAVALYCLTCEDEPGPQIKCAATTGDQARIVWGIAKKMAEKTTAFREQFSIEPMANSIVCGMNLGSMQPINAKASSQDGLNPHLSIFDELHAHKDRALFDVLRSARGARRNPLQWIVTTAGFNLEGVCYEQRKLAAKVLEGVIQADHLFAMIYTLDEGDDPLNPDVWPKANPNLGVSIYLRDMEAYSETAKASADSLIEFQTKRCNVWAGSRAPWINLDKWKRCATEIDLGDMEGATCWGGVDLAATSDITAFSLVFPGDGVQHVVCRMYVPEAIVKPRSERGNVPYQSWVKAGWLIETPGDVTDYSYIERDIREALARFNVRGIAFDPWNAYDLVNRLSEDDAPMVEFRQGPKSYAPAMKEFERSVDGKTLRHDGNPVLQWMASNLVVRKDVNDNMAPDKRASEEKIDGIVATIMALGLAATHTEDGPSVYEARGLRII